MGGAENGAGQPALFGRCSMKNGSTIENPCSLCVDRGVVRADSLDTVSFPEPGANHDALNRPKPGVDPTFAPP